MLGVIVNTVAVLLGSVLGTVFKKGIPKKVTDAIMIGIGLCVIYIGISGALKGKNTLVLILSMIFGAAIGTLIDIDNKMNRLGAWVEKKFSKNGTVSIAQGFVTGSLLFCVGSMTVIGSLNAGLQHDNQMLYTKSLLDFISSTMLAATLGIGVAFSAVIVLLFQGGMVLLAQLLQNFLSDSAVAEMTCAGSVIIIALGLNLIGISKFKVANYMPAILLAPFFSWIVAMLPFSI
jgi:uncharacterized membrane protein YqgA involved in biofilm formation